MHARDPRLAARQQLGREVAERADDARRDELDLAQQIGLAGLDLFGLGVAVVRRPRLEHVGDVDLLAREADGAEELLEQLARLADERPALLVFVVAGRLAYEHEVAVRVALAEHDAGAGAREQAALAGLGLAPQPLQLDYDRIVSGRWHRTSPHTTSSSCRRRRRRGRPTWSGRRSWTADGGRRRSAHSGQRGLSPLRTSSSNRSSHCSQMNS